MLADRLNDVFLKHNIQPNQLMTSEIISLLSAESTTMMDTMMDTIDQTIFERPVGELSINRKRHSQGDPGGMSGTGKHEQEADSFLGRSCPNEQGQRGLSRKQIYSEGQEASEKCSVYGCCLRTTAQCLFEGEI